MIDLYYCEDGTTVFPLQALNSNINPKHRSNILTHICRSCFIWSGIHVATKHG